MSDPDIQARVDVHNKAILKEFGTYGFNKKLTLAAKADYKTKHLEFRTAGCQHELYLVIEGGGSSAKTRLYFDEERPIDLLQVVPLKERQIDWHLDDIRPQTVLSDVYAIIEDPTHLFSISQKLFLEVVKQYEPTKLEANLHEDCQDPVCMLLAAKELNAVLLVSQFRFEFQLGGSPAQVKYVGLATCLENSKKEQALITKPANPPGAPKDEWERVKLLELGFIPLDWSGPCPSYAQSRAEVPVVARRNRADADASP